MKTAHHSERRFVPRRPHGRLLASLTALLLVAAAWGCFGGNRTTTLPFQYSLEYASPRFDDLPPLDAALSLERFSSAQGINKTAMIYRSEPYRYDAYYGHYWRSRPRDLATDFLLRDLKYARLFKAVFSYQDRQETRFVLQGAVTECAAHYEPQGDQRAVLSLSLTLLDTQRKVITEQVVFVKRYDLAPAMDERSPRAFARGISAAMETLSPQMLSDVHRAVRERLAATSAPSSP
ncbi:MAG: ABC-type transport auxiliary lipoprotein family protein [Syntrophales bacterium]|nr:ABC-type transport auxiliary lipoprotein family protein [Syntrophales bacterium]HQN26282.1 ABC-type transport auxiliary lipoprotein family protein [Syntrophales bacterium]